MRIEEKHGTAKILKFVLIVLWEWVENAEFSIVLEKLFGIRLDFWKWSIKFFRLQILFPATESTVNGGNIYMKATGIVRRKELLNKLSGRNQKLIEGALICRL